MSDLGAHIEQRKTKEESLAHAYAEAELLCEFRDRARMERMIVETTFQDCPIDRLRAMKEHEEKAKLFDAICEAILGGEL